MPDIKIASLEGHEFTAYCAYPASGRGPGLIVIQEIFGVNANMRRVCDEYAAKGYIAVCPDLFWRQEPGVQLDDNLPQDKEHAFAMFQRFDVEAGVRDLLSTLGAIRRMPECNGKIGAIGYCLGGRLAYLMATRSDIDVSVGYYGVDIDKYLDEVHDIRMPHLMHIAALDRFVPPETRAKILRAIGRNEVITAHVYEGVDHAFARVGGETFDKDAAYLANTRTAEFLANTLLV